MSYLRTIVVVSVALAWQSMQAQTLLRGRLTTNDAVWQDSPVLPGATITNMTVSSNLTVAGAAVRPIAAGANITFSTNSGVITIAGSAGGGGSVTANTNQFATNSTLTLKDGAWVTNLSVYGVGVNVGTGQLRLGGSYGTVDLQLLRDDAATLQLGTNAASPTTQTVKAHNGLGTDVAGAALVVAGGKSTGAGIGGALVAKTSQIGGSGSAVNDYTTRHYVYAGIKTFTESAAVSFVKITLPNASFGAAEVFITFRASDGFGNWNCSSDVLHLSAVNDGSTLWSGAPSVGTQSVSGTGTLTVTYSSFDNGDGTFSIRANVVSDGFGEPPTIVGMWQMRINADKAATVTPQ